MHNWNRVIATLVITFVCLAPVSAGGISRSAAEPVAPQSITESVPVVMIALKGDDFVRIPPPPQFHRTKAPMAAMFSINYLAAGTPDGQGAICLAWDSNAQAAFSYAASIWATLVNSSVPIRINACWANLGDPDVLGYSWSNLAGNFSGAPVANTWYSFALADRLAGYDLSANPDFYITYNNGFSWYTGTDGNTPAGQYDLVSVALHEMGHGLNFAGSMQYGTSGGCGASNYGCWGYGTVYPNIYDRFTENGSVQSLINTGLFPNPSAALGTQLTSNDLYFNGPNANAANGGSRVRIYAPNPWNSGSSYSHLDYNTFRTTPNRLMVYAISSASSIHDPGSVTMGLLNDLGWRSTVLVDDDYNSSTPGWGHTHFASIQNGINAIPSGGIVLVYNGTYTESATLNKTATITLTGNITLNGSLSISAGTFNATTGTLRLSGDLTRSGGTFNHNNGTVTFNGSGAQAIGGSSSTFNNLTVNKSSSTLTLNVNTPIASNLSVSAGTLDLGAYTANRTAAGGTLSVSNGATLKIGGTNSMPTNYATYSLNSTSTVEYAGTNQSVSATPTYGRLTTSGSGIKTLGGATAVAGNLTIGAGTTLDVSASNHALNVGGDWTSNGTFNARSGTVTLDGSGTQNLAANVATTLNNLTVNSSVTLVETVSTDNVTVNGTLTNNGVISKTQSISSTGARTFGLTGVSMNVATLGTLSSVRAVRRDTNHPNATVGIQTGRYWALTPTGSGFSVTLTLPATFTPDADDKLCRYTGTGQVWDCAMSSFTSNNITRNGVTQFSDWAAGNDVGPLVITLASFTSQSASEQPAAISWALAALAGLLAGLTVLIRRKHA